MAIIPGAMPGMIYGHSKPTNNTNSYFFIKNKNKTT
jgi:hypothetical protein